LQGDRQIHSYDYVEELKKLRGELFRYADYPLRETFLRFIAENPGATFPPTRSRATASPLFTAATKTKAPVPGGSGMGPLQATGRQIMKEIIAGGH
jgi:hypothetical protein